ncbi:hypothetical protein GCM10010967_30940 [Dyadobacter beijingensis]|uniref:DUF4270 family protein n=2 Tax=Dyadobacter beijingensis TaxID=365489 RepID=A0ABQ2I2I0_9BACT|nr:hypothetical protein GCM10010967_30940 [Dyadobacter beijingensis]
MLIAALFTLALSCTDHDVPANLPESACTAIDGSPRLYPCEFLIESITFLAKDGTDLATVTGSMQMASLSRFQAKVNTNTGNVVGSMGAATYDVRIRVKRIASPSFPVNVGYLVGYTHNGAGKAILHTPSFPGDTYGERTKFGPPVTLDMAIGETRDIFVEKVFPYSIADFGSGIIKPSALFAVLSIFIDNDVTTLNFNRTIPPYSYVGSVVEAYYEKLNVQISN